MGLWRELDVHVWLQYVRPYCGIGRTVSSCNTALQCLLAIVWVLEYFFYQCPQLYIFRPTFRCSISPNSSHTAQCLSLHLFTGRSSQLPLSIAQTHNRLTPGTREMHMSFTLSTHLHISLLCTLSFPYVFFIYPVSIFLQVFSLCLLKVGPQRSLQYNNHLDVTVVS